MAAIAEHIQNIYESGELEKLATISKIETVRQVGVRRVKRELDDSTSTRLYLLGTGYKY
jgi:hypothetical protein